MDDEDVQSTVWLTLRLLVGRDDSLRWSCRLRGRLCVQHLPHHGLCVAKSAPESLAAAKLTNQRQTKRPRLSRIVDERHGAHQRTQNHLAVVLEEVDLIAKHQQQTARIHWLHHDYRAYT